MSTNNQESTDNSSNEQNDLSSYLPANGRMIESSNSHMSPILIQALLSSTNNTHQYQSSTLLTQAAGGQTSQNIATIPASSNQTPHLATSVLASLLSDRRPQQQPPQELVSSTSSALLAAALAAQPSRTLEPSGALLAATAALLQPSANATLPAASDPSALLRCLLGSAINSPLLPQSHQTQTISLGANAAPPANSDILRTNLLLLERQQQQASMAQSSSLLGQNSLSHQLGQANYTPGIMGANHPALLLLERQQQAQALAEVTLLQNALLHQLGQANINPAILGANHRQGSGHHSAVTANETRHNSSNLIASLLGVGPSQSLTLPLSFSAPLEHDAARATCETDIPTGALSRVSVASGTIIGSNPAVGERGIRSSDNGDSSNAANLRFEEQTTVANTLTNRPPILLAVDTDEHRLSPYQTLLRKQIELFETTTADLGGKAQGRNAPVRFGQVGIRCRHCAALPPSKRSSGSILYSKTQTGIYQISQNMCKTHFLSVCRNIPEDTRQALVKLRDKLNRGSGGKQYWSDALDAIGVVEDGRLLRFTSVIPAISSTRSKDE